MTPQERAAANIARTLWINVLNELAKTPNSHVVFSARKILLDLMDIVKQSAAEVHLIAAYNALEESIRNAKEDF